MWAQKKWENSDNLPGRWLSDTNNLLHTIFLNDTKAATPLRSDMASLVIQADMWIGKHVPNIWKQKDQPDSLFVWSG